MAGKFATTPELELMVGLIIAEAFCVIFVFKSPSKVKKSLLLAKIAGPASPKIKPVGRYRKEMIEEVINDQVIASQK